MKIRTHKTTAEHEAFYQDMAAVLKKYEHLPAEQLLAIASNMVGKLVAMQDQRKYTAAAVMEVVAQNIEAGNAQMIAELMASKGSA
jgi:hypothetical protein